MSVRRAVRQRRRPQKRRPPFPPLRTRYQKRHRRLRRVLGNDRPSGNRRNVGTLRNVRAFLNENGTGILRRPFGPRDTRLGVMNRPRYGNARIRVRNLRSGRDDGNPASERDGRSLRRTISRSGFGERPGTPLGVRKRDDARRPGIGDSASARNRDRRRGRPNRGVERHIRHHREPPAERQRILGVVSYRRGILFRFGQGRPGGRPDTALGVLKLRVRLRSLMRKRLGGRKRRHGLVFRFYAIVLDVSDGETLDILNHPLGRTPRLIRPYGPILPLCDQKIRTPAPVLHLRRRRSDDGPRQSLRTYVRRIRLSDMTRVQRRGVRVRGFVRFQKHRITGGAFFRRADHEARKGFPHPCRKRSPHGWIRGIRTLRLYLRQSRTARKDLENTAAIKKPSRTEGFSLPEG